MTPFSSFGTVPCLVLKVIAAGGAACRSEAFLVAFGHAVDSRPRWLLRRTVHVRQVG